LTAEENARPFCRLRELWPSVKRESILGKYQAALEWVNIAADSSEGNTLEKLGRRLRSEFPPNPFYRRPHFPYFPYQCLGFGCASWCIKSALTFADAFGERLDLKLEHMLMLQITPAKFDV
jgi:hypothetical protein